MAGAGDDVFVGAEFGEAHGAAGVEAIGTDTDLGAETKLETVVEAVSAGVPLSTARTVIETTAGPWASVGVQEI